MLKHTSVGSSTPQVRNPSALHKFRLSETLANLVEPLPFTSQLVKDFLQPTLEKNQFYAWKRPSNLKSQWLLLTDTSPAILVDTRNNSTVWSLKFPYDTRQVQKVGTIICEAAYSPQDSTLWVWDLVLWEGKDLWSTTPYSKRWELLQTKVRPMIHENHPLCDIRIQYPEWMSLQQCLNETEEPGYSIDFQPEKAGQRRLAWLIPKQGDTFHAKNFHERKMMSETTCIIIDEDDMKPLKALQEPMKPLKTLQEPVKSSKTLQEPVKSVKSSKTLQEPTPTNVQEPDKATQAILTKDKLSKLPDTYKLTSESGEDLGLAAVRSMDMSSKLRSIMTSSNECKVEIVWYEPFQKYEVRKV